MCDRPVRDQISCRLQLSTTRHWISASRCQHVVNTEPIAILSVSTTCFEVEFDRRRCHRIWKPSASQSFSDLSTLRSLSCDLGTTPQSVFQVSVFTCLSKLIFIGNWHAIKAMFVWTTAKNFLCALLSHKTHIICSKRAECSFKRHIFCSWVSLANDQLKRVPLK